MSNKNIDTKEHIFICIEPLLPYGNNSEFRLIKKGDILKVSRDTDGWPRVDLKNHTIPKDFKTNWHYISANGLIKHFRIFV